MSREAYETRNGFRPWGSRPLSRGLSVLLVALAITGLATAQTENPVPATTVSGASFAPPVAPDSLATVFGTQLSKNVVSAQLDSRGQLPTELDGTKLEVNGRAAPLIFVSPNQINFLVPADTEIGAASVVVKASAAGFTSRGTVAVRTVASAIFSFDASGKGRGAILNGVTFKPDPFAVETPENKGTDKRTRLAIYATGVRFAGNPERAASKTNVAVSVRAEARDATGKLWPLGVEYAGPAPGFFGLDQVNVVLPAEADGMGILTVTVTAESSLSNTVTLTVRNLRPPQIFSFYPLSSPPGGELTVQGSGFVSGTGSASAPRSVVVLDTGKGVEVPVAGLVASGNSLRAFVPPIVAGDQGQWYQGPVRVCVEIDQQRACHGQLLTIEAPAKPSLPPGGTLRDVGSKLLQTAVATLNQAGNTAGAQAVQAGGQANLDEFDAMVRDAVAGRPRSITFENIDGTMETAVFDLATLERMESLLTAYQGGAGWTISRLDMLSAEPSAQAAARVCTLLKEGEMEGQKQARDTIRFRQKTLAYTSLGIPVAAAVTACVKAGPLCGTAAAAVIKLSLPTVGYAYTLASWPSYYSQIEIEYGTNLLESISAEPSDLDVAPGASSTFKVLGRFVPISPETRWGKIVERAIMDLMFAAFPFQEMPVAKDIVQRIAVALAKMAVKDWANKTAPRFAGSTSTLVELGEQSITVAPRDHPRAGVTLACIPNSGTVLGKVSSAGHRILFDLAADKNNLLLLDEGSIPFDYLRVLVGSPLSPSVTTNKATFQQGDIVTVSGIDFSPRARVRTTWTDAQGREQVFENQTDDQGKFSFSVPLAASAPTGTYKLTAVLLGTSATGSAQFSVTARVVVTLVSVTISPTTATGGGTATGTVTLSGPAPAEGLLIALQSSNPAAKVPASVTVSAGETSATFTVTTQAVSAAQNVTITASYAGVSKTATLTVNPAQGGSQPGTVRVNPQDGLNYVWIPAGTYMMGCSPGDSQCYSNESPSHSVTISKGFWMGQTEVTVGAYKRFAQATGRAMPYGQDNLPVDMVTWEDAHSYCTWAGGRLPTEADWEYAARAGTQTKYYYGNDAALLGDYAWYSSNSGGVRQPVGQKKPNAWGLYDMLGNVWEWCQDWYGSYPSQAVTDPQGPSSGSIRILRGGSCWDGTSGTRVSGRIGGPEGGYGAGGFRCVREAIPESAASVSLEALTLSQSSVTAGASVTGTVTLSAAAPAGGASVTLQSTSTAAQVPASVTVAAGQTSATFTITTQAVSAAQNVTITASYAGVSKTATLTVNPAQGGSQPGTVRVSPQDGLNYVWIPPGTYMMGCSPGDSECFSDETPSHSVTISKGFWMGQTEVTVGAYKRFAQATGRAIPSGEDSLPMVNVNWNDARSYCTWAGGRLPTEAEWEHAARAGTQTKYYFGNDGALLADYAWYYGNSADVTHPVGQKKPNAWGLYDMLGNVWEWCQDWYESYPSQAATDPQGPSSGSYRILRGGSWHNDPWFTRVSVRGAFTAGDWVKHYGYGFRCVWEVIP
jgi:uncharacterized protein (TIGR03437 family)